MSNTATTLPDEIIDTFGTELVTEPQYAWDHQQIVRVDYVPTTNSKTHDFVLVLIDLDGDIIDRVRPDELYPGMFTQVPPEALRNPSTWYRELVHTVMSHTELLQRETAGLSLCHELGIEIEVDADKLSDSPIIDCD